MLILKHCSWTAPFSCMLRCFSPGTCCFDPGTDRPVSYAVFLWIEKIARGLTGIEPEPLCIESLLWLFSVELIYSMFSSVGIVVIKISYLLCTCLGSAPVCLLLRCFSPEARCLDPGTGRLASFKLYSLSWKKIPGDSLESSPPLYA